MPATRPEFEAAPEEFYSDREARQYHVSTRIQTVQRDMTARALELLALPPGASALVLDVGCGSGISGDVITAAGHAWVGVDVSRDMLRIAKADELHAHGLAAPGETDPPALRQPTPRHLQIGPLPDEDEEAEESEESEEDEGPVMAEVLLNDIGQGVPFRPGTFDACVSISVLQWLCHSSRKGEVPQRRLMAFFQSLYNTLRRGAKAVLQFYPSDPQQVHMITRAAMKCGFGGGVVVDFPHSSKARKHYLVLQAGQIAGGFVPPAPLTADVSGSDDEEDEEDEEDGYGDDADAAAEERSHVRIGGREHGKRPRSSSRNPRGAPATKRRRKDNRPVTGTREWVLLKKAERRRRGEKTTEDSKYTMRRRKPRF